VNDAATGQPTPCRLRFTGEDGAYYAPFGRLTEFATGVGEDVGGNLLLANKRYAYIDGSCEVALPAGVVNVDVTKGFEFAPLQDQVQLKKGQLSLRLAIKRWSDARQDRWYSGDARVHFLTPEAALLEATAEDVAMVNLLAAEHTIRSGDGRDYRAVSNILAFSGQQPGVETPGYFVAVNTLNRHPVLGSLSLLSCHRPVYPLGFGGPESSDDWTLADWCDQCHRKGGLVVWAENDATRLKTGGLWGEPLADLLLGKIDALETDFNEVSSEDQWWDGLLSCGLRLPLVGASGKESNREAVGAVRTFARLLPGEPLTYKNWIEAVRAGRTYVSNGPLLSLTVDGRDPGAVIDVPSPDKTVHVRAESRCGLPLSRLRVLLNGKAVASARADGSPSTATVELDLPVSKPGWIRAVSEGPREPLEGRLIMAISSPVYVHVNGQSPRPDKRTANRFDSRLDSTLEWVRTHGRFESEHQRDRLAGIFLAAREELERRAKTESR
jgi:hypothetical protein